MSGKAGKPGNVMDFENCNGNVRYFTKSQGNVRDKLVTKSD